MLVLLQGEIGLRRVATQRGALLVVVATTPGPGLPLSTCLSGGPPPPLGLWAAPVVIIVPGGRVRARHQRGVGDVGMGASWGLGQGAATRCTRFRGGDGAVGAVALDTRVETHLIQMSDCFFISVYVAYQFFKCGYVFVSSWSKLVFVDSGGTNGVWVFNMCPW